MVAYCASGLVALGHPPHEVAHCGGSARSMRARQSAHLAFSLRRPGERRPRAGVAQTILRVVRLRAPSGRGRRHRRALALILHKSSPLTRVSNPCCPVENGQRGIDPSRLAPSDAGRPLALESQPGARASRVYASRQASANPSPAHGSRRPLGGGVAWVGGVPGERPSRSGCGPPIMCWPARRWTTVYARGCRSKAWWTCGPRSSPGEVQVHLVESSDPLGDGPRHLERSSFYVLGRRTTRGAPDACPCPQAGPRRTGAERVASAHRSTRRARSRIGGHGLRPGPSTCAHS